MGGNAGLIVTRRLHRLVRHGYRPWLGYDVASGQDQDIQLHFKQDIATLRPDGSVSFARPRPGSPATIAGDDATAFDTLFPPNAPNRRNLTRRLYEMGF